MAKKSNIPKQNTPQRQPVKNAPPAPKKAAPAPVKAKAKGMSLITKLCIGLALLAFALYGNTLRNGFVLDDVMVIKDNVVVPQGMSKIPDILSTLRLEGYANMSNEYRPISLVMFATECDLARMLSPEKNPFNAGIHHFFNVLVFAGCLIVLFLFLNKLFNGQRPAVALMATILFAAHPIHTEIVANIKSRDELCCFFFAFLALNFFADYMKQAKNMQLLWGTLALFLSYLSKETVITFLAVIPLIFFFYINDDRKRAIMIMGGTLISTVLYLGIRASIVKAKGNSDFPINFVDNMLANPQLAPSSRLATEILILGEYIKLLFIPYPLCIDRSYNSIHYATFANIGVIVSLLAYIGLVVLAIMLLRKNRKDPWAFGILFFLATISLFSNIAIMLASTFAERFLFFCSVGVCLVIALAIEKWLIGKEGAGIEELKGSKAMYALVPICLIFSVITFARNTDWENSYTLYKADVAKMPENTRLNYYVASELQKKCGAETDTVKIKKYNDESIAYLKKSLQIYIDNTDAQAEIGAAYFREHKFDSAKKHLLRALELNPKKSNALANLGTLYLTMNDYANALIYYRSTNIWDPRNVVAQFNGAVCYYQLHKLDSAIIGFKNTIILSPDFYNYKSYEFAAITYRDMGKMDSARMYEMEARKYNAAFKL